MKNTFRRIAYFFGYKPANKLDRLVQRGLKIGENFKMLEGCIIDDSHCWHIEIGNNVTLAPRVHILAHDASTKMHLNYTKVRNVKIGDRVFIGAGSIILPGSKIGNDVIIGAGSIVSGKIQSNSVISGNPAKYICSTTEYLEKNRLKMSSTNTFGEEYTIRQNVDELKKNKMKNIIEEEGIGFVI